MDRLVLERDKAVEQRDDALEAARLRDVELYAWRAHERDVKQWAQHRRDVEGGSWGDRVLWGTGGAGVGFFIGAIVVVLAGG